MILWLFVPTSIVSDPFFYCSFSYTDEERIKNPIFSAYVLNEWFLHLYSCKVDPYLGYKWNFTKIYNVTIKESKWSIRELYTIARGGRENRSSTDSVFNFEWPLHLIAKTGRDNRFRSARINSYFSLLYIRCNPMWENYEGNIHLLRDIFILYII